MTSLRDDLQPAQLDYLAVLQQRTMEQTRSLIAEGFDQERALRIATARAEHWARRHGMPESVELHGHQHVVPYGERWAVWTDGIEGAGGVFETRYEATLRARSLAQQGEALVVIHALDGQIQDVVMP
jgi:hypothetical protein